MKKAVEIGTPPWSRNEIAEKLEEFTKIYAERPIKENACGMRSSHMFAVWFMLKQLNPDLIVECGIWKGQSTWLIEQACPDAKIVSIDINLSSREYVSQNVTYSSRDFSKQDWTGVTDRSVAFFDDHQNAYERVKQCYWYGFKNIIFEDNYFTKGGDCYSMKQAFAHTTPADHLNGVNDPVTKVHANSFDEKMLRKHLEIYSEFPPVFIPNKTRWDADWDRDIYPTPDPLLTTVDKPELQVYLDEAMFYTWICYVKLKPTL